VEAKAEKSSADLVLGIIPARGGSKRLPGKNLKLFNGKSLIQVTIEQAKKALPVSVVTTEDSKIILEALKHGVKVLLRPTEYATDDASSADVVKHVLWTYPQFEWFCLLQPTSPLRSVEDIKNCVEIALSTGKSVHSTYQGKPNGAIYIGHTWNWCGDFWSGIQYEMPEERSIDIDTLEDFLKAEKYANAVRTPSTGEILYEMHNFQPAPKQRS
jgi:CMP-N-acetylneuraminic acid synthetase